MSDLDRMRAYVRGELDAAAAAEFEARLADDAVLADLAETYRAVERATPDDVPALGITFDGLQLAPPARRRVLVIAAAAVLVLGAAAYFSFRPRVAPRPPPAVTLHAIPLAPLPEPPAAPAWPAALARHRTADAGGLVWLDDYAAARELASWTGRPLVLTFDYKQCPLCRRFDRVHFRDDELIAHAESFVLVRIDVEKMPPELAGAVPRGWPVMAVFDAQGERLAYRTGMTGLEDMRDWLGEQAARHGAGVAPWSRLRGLARRLRSAREAEPEAQWHAWRAVAADPGRLASVAKAHLAGMRYRAQAALRKAEAQPETARDVLADAAARLRGTPYAADLRRIIDHLDTYGAWPRLETRS